MKRLAILLAVWLCAAVASPAFANEDATKIIEGSVSGFVRPAYAALHERADALAGAVQTLCAQPSQANLGSARESFQAETDAWSYAEIIRFGPITEQNRLERMLFWPDRKGIGLKQVQATLAARDAAAADPAQLPAKSVGMQGLGALEFVLFGTDAEALATPGDPYRCLYGAAVAVNIATIAGAVDAAWASDNGFAGKWAHPGAGNPLYQSGTEAVTELLEVFVNGLELVRDVRVGGFLGDQTADDKPRQAIYWRSDGTARSLAANMAGLKALFAASGLGDELSPDAHWIAESIVIQFANAIDDANAIDGPIAEALTTEAKRARLSHFRLVTSSLSNLFGKRLSAEFGLTAGFSSLDGD
jgi:predicted lipoprotein